MPLNLKKAVIGNPELGKPFIPVWFTQDAGQHRLSTIHAALGLKNVSDIALVKDEGLVFLVPFEEGTVEAFIDRSASLQARIKHDLDFDVHIEKLKPERFI